MKEYKVGIIGGTGMVGQRFITLMENHPWFRLTVIAASARSAGKPYGEAAEKPLGHGPPPSPPAPGNLVVMDAVADAEKIASHGGFLLLRRGYAERRDPGPGGALRQAGVPHRLQQLRPPLDGGRPHGGAGDQPGAPGRDRRHQRKRLGTERGFIAVKSNCSLQSYVPALHPLRKYGLASALVCTYQAISGAGKTFERWPEMVDNCIPYIGGEEEKSEKEPLKLFGQVEDGKIVPAQGPAITAQCFRVACLDGHMAAVFMKFRDGCKPSIEQIKADWASYRGIAQELKLPSAPQQFLHYMEEPDRPQAKLDRMCENGMAISPGPPAG